MAVRSFRTRLLLLILIVLVLLQAGTLISVRYAGQRTLRKSVAEELRVGARVFERVLVTRERQLADSLRVLALDFAFRAAVASDDVPTILSVLANHGSRIDADAVVLVDLDGKVTADTLGRLSGTPFPFPMLLERARQEGEAFATVSLDDRPYQFVVAPVLAPRPIAWVCAGFEIDEAVLSDIRRLTSLDVSLWNSATGDDRLLITTLAPEQRQLLAERLPSLSEREMTRPAMHLGDVEYATLFVPLVTADGSRYHTLVQRSLDEAGRPFTELQMQILTLSTLALLAAIIAAFFFSRSVTHPLRVLADGAARIEHGDYLSPLEVRREDEVGQLATAFNAMRAAIATREEQITHQSRHDALTGLPNRTLFLERLAHCIELASHSGGAVRMVMMDVDRFKEINDTLGHSFGDQLLVEIGRRLTHTLQKTDVVARLGGDEFAVMVTAPRVDAIPDIAERIHTAFDRPFILGDVSIEVDASLGIATFPLHADDADTLMKRADIAMYDAKKNRSRVAVYEAGRDEYSLRRLALLTELRQAIGREELELHFQPKIDVRSEHVVHAEALVRWRHPTHGMMPPDEFIPLAEHAGHIALITRWVLRRAISRCAEWNANGFEIAVAVNLSALDLFDSELPTYISGLLSDSGLPPTRLVIEITESAVMKDPAYAQKILRELKQRGLTLAIDDFGTGYSSLAHLKRLPVDELKIDKSFVRHLGQTAGDDHAIVRATIELGHTMGLVVVAEGVETAESLDVLRRLECDLAQGYLISRPLDAAAFADWLANSSFAAPRA